MISLEFRRINYRFSWKSSIIFIIFCPLTAFCIIMITNYFWLYFFPLYIFPAGILTSIFVGKICTISLNTNYTLQVPDSVGVYFTLGCSPYPAIVLFLAICLIAPHNKIRGMNKNIWKRKILTFIISSIIIFIVNSFRIAITIYLYHIGTPYYPMHDILEYITTFIAVFTFFICTYSWLPEILISGIWNIESIKNKVSKRHSLEIKNMSHQVKKIKINYILLFWMPICIFIGTGLSILVYQKIF
ncbi:MAG: archaeosortase/exosortase family protein [Candidatus Lokiarchaeota archaeon]|nr:archaeosortase/exosortase family protein [Candidatus Lokiarchaeota archaeon]